MNDNLDRAIRDCKGKYDGKNHTLFEGNRFYPHFYSSLNATQVAGLKREPEKYILF